MIRNGGRVCSLISRVLASYAQRSSEFDSHHPISLGAVVHIWNPTSCKFKCPELYEIVSIK